MSEETTCNWCSMRDLRMKARQKRLKVTVLPGRTFGQRGVQRGIDVFVHPSKIVITQLRPDQREKFWQQWFLELPSQCVC